MFHKIPVELPKPSSPKEKYQSLLHAIRDGWYMNTLIEKLPPQRKGNQAKKHNKRRIK